jgi:RNA polymerase sigma factor (sigma-70 family)
MDDPDGVTREFEANRDHLRAVAYRMLGSLSEADDALQESWLRVSRSGTDGVDNMGGWLTTIVARVCLNMLRARRTRSRNEEAPSDAGGSGPDAVGSGTVGSGVDPEQEALLADSVGLALLVVLDTLTPAERLAFVLHDMFDLPFDEIAPMLGRSSPAARQLASRARRRVRGGSTAPRADQGRQREVVEAYLAAARGGDFEALLRLLDPDVVLRSDAAAVAVGASAEVFGAAAVAAQAVARRARSAQEAMVNGAVGAVVAPNGRLLLALSFTLDRGKIVAIDVTADPDQLSRITLAVLDT